MPDHNPFEFYETPETFTRHLWRHLVRHGAPGLSGRMFEPCVGTGAIPRALGRDLTWRTNDLDRQRVAETHLDARHATAWTRGHAVDWVITNPPFSIWPDVLAQALPVARCGVALFVRLSALEPLRTGPRRRLLALHPPTLMLPVPRFAFQRSPTNGGYSTDSMGCCWLVWIDDWDPHGLIAPREAVYAELDAETVTYRARMDAIMGLTGTERDRRQQVIDKCGAIDHDPPMSNMELRS